MLWKFNFIATIFFKKIIYNHILDVRAFRYTSLSETAFANGKLFPQLFWSSLVILTQWSHTVRPQFQESTKVSVQCISELMLYTTHNHSDFRVTHIRILLLSVTINTLKVWLSLKLFLILPASSQALPIHFPHTKGILDGK